MQKPEYHPPESGARPVRRVRRDAEGHKRVDYLTVSELVSFLHAAGVGVLKAEGADPQQLQLALEFAPEDVRKHGLQAAHPRPLASLGKQPGREFRSFRTSPAKAWRYPEVEYANAGASYAALVLDCDDPERIGAVLDELPLYNWQVRRVANGHAHLAWALAIPVHRYPKARIEPLEYLAYISEYYQYVAGADSGYTGILAHNPAPHYRQSEFKTIWGREAPYELEELAQIIPFNWTPPKAPQTAIGRNCGLFASGMEWAGRRANAGLDVYTALVATNQKFETPLCLGEVADTANSIERYRARWAANGWHRPTWIAKQRRVSAMQTGKARKASASPEGSNEALKPWEAEGISRRWWYELRRREKQSALSPTQVSGSFPQAR